MKLTLGKKLGMGFGVILALIMLNTVLAYLKANAIKATQEQVTTVLVPSIAACKDLQRDLNQLQSKGRQAILAGAQPERREVAKRTFDENWNDVEKDVVRMEELAPKWTLQADRDRLTETKQELPSLREFQQAAMKHAAGSERGAIVQAGNEFADTASPVTEAIKKPLGELADSEDKLLQQATLEMKAANRAMDLTLAVTTFAALGIGSFLAFFLIRSITGADAREKLAAAEVAQGAEREKLAAEELKHKVDSILTVVAAATTGDLTQEIQVRGSDAIGQMGESLAKFFADLRKSIGSIGESAANLASASEELTTVSHQMSANAEETSAQTKVASAATLQVSQNLQTVATGAEEMGASIKEIAKNATEAAKVATSAVKVAETANATVSKLGDSSAEIGQVIKVITTIAQQTNLLALNATIEAARAGEAGKGFAVVANEVKELAKETAKATEDISRKIEAIQTDTKAAVEAIGTISEVINQINGISSTIASAVEEQNATTNEMSRNVSDAARGSAEITSNIVGVEQAAESTSRGASDTQKAAQDLVQTSTQLRHLVEQFKINVNERAPGDSGAAMQTQSRAARVGS
jgi:methyl-accepting chemotaxis protein